MTSRSKTNSNGSDTSQPPSRLGSVLGDGDAALARSKAYRFLAQLVGGPVSAELFAQAASVPELAGSASQEPLGLDELAAAHYELFGLQVFPYAGVFLDVACLAGGDRVADMVERYRRWGFAFGESEGQDHFACQLNFLAHLTGLEAGFRARANEASVKRVRDEARNFLDTHLLPWAIPFLAAVHAADAPLFTRATEMAVRVAADHRQELAEGVDVAGPEVGPEAAVMLANSKTSVRDIAEFLLAPSRSGAWISRADMQGLGRGSDVPRGFGSRVQLLSNLLRNAAEYELAEALLGAIDSLLAEQAARYTAISTELSLGAFAAPWLERMDATRQMIDTMAHALPLASAIEEE